jgi:hypothetical protein
MNPYFTKALYEDFPTLYAQHDSSMQDTLMCWNFENGDGWEQLIRDLSQQLEFLNDTAPVWVEAAQVKEKFGTLRFYVDITGDKPWRDLIYYLINYAEARSAWTCEQCGEYGKLRPGGWVRTLCDSCHDELLTRKAAPVETSNEY